MGVYSSLPPSTIFIKMIWYELYYYNNISRRDNNLFSMTWKKLNRWKGKEKKIIIVKD